MSSFKIDYVLKGSVTVPAHVYAEFCEDKDFDELSPAEQIAKVKEIEVESGYEGIMNDLATGDVEITSVTKVQ